MPNSNSKAGSPEETASALTSTRLSKHSANDGEIPEPRLHDKPSSESAFSFARQNVSLLLEEKIDAWPSTPKLIRDFLVQHWQPLLLKSYLKAGKDSREWQQLNQLAEDLLWLAQVAEDPKSVQRLPLLIPACHQNIVRHLQQSERPSSEWRESMQQISKQHDEQLSSCKSTMEEQHVAVDRTLPTSASNDDARPLTSHTQQKP